MSKLTVQEKIDLIKSIGEEIVGEEDLHSVLSSNKELITYDGFEPSGQMHIAQGIQRAINVNKMIKAGFKFKMLVADWFGYLNNKMGGDIEKIKTVGKYFIEIWRASGMDLDGVEFVWTSEMIKDAKYWELVMKVGRANSLKRILKTTQIMGRNENDDLSAAMVFYPCMQTADVFELGAQITQLGMDQRKVNMLAREVGPELGFWKPIVVSHHMLLGLGTPKTEYLVENVQVEIDKTQVYEVGDYIITVGYATEEDFVKITIQSKSMRKQEMLTIPKSKINEIISQEAEGGSQVSLKLEKKLGIEMSITMVSSTVLGFELKVPKQSAIDRAIDMKMSKSVPDSAIFMTDTRDNIERKIKKAFCPEGVIEDNPVLEYCKYIIFEAHHLKGHEDLLKDGFIVKRPEKWGGDVVYKSYDEVEKAFANKSLSSVDLKAAVIEYVDRLVSPVREHFVKEKDAKKLLESVQKFQVTW